MHKCFLIEPSGKVAQTICVIKEGCSNLTYNGSHRAEYIVKTDYQNPKSLVEITITDEDLKDLPPTIPCELCNEILEVKNYSKGARAYWKRLDTNEELLGIHVFPIGAMWYATTWYKSSESDLYGWDWDNQFTPPLMVHTPGGDWNIDSRASNCSLPNEKTHRCWVRHGDPPSITVDKNGHTCQAGAGSIVCGSYHGFLRDGYLTD